MAANSALNLTSLDFDTLKQNFIQFLSSQSVFKDYNFTGSNMNVLLDVLSYNTFMNAFYLNMVSSEMFLDSAQKMDSVVSHAKELNYLPRSAKSAVASISFTLDTTGCPEPFLVPEGTIFSGTNASGAYTFVTATETAYFSGNTYTDIYNTKHIVYDIENLAIQEGSYLQDSFVVDYTQPGQRYVFSNPNIDTNTLSIQVIENNGANSQYYERADNLYGVNDTSKIYFLQATFNNRFELVFGDGIFGYKPQNGAVIIARYITTSGSAGNGVEQFTLDQNLGSINGGSSGPPSIITMSGSDGGSDAESLESIKYNAPRHYQTQSRCVTTNDYEITILQNFPEIESVSVYSGGVTNTAVQYGTVFVSPSTTAGNVLSNSRKQDLITYIGGLSPVGISIQIIDPEYLYITVNSKIHCDFGATTSPTSVILNSVIQTAKSFNSSNLQAFNTAFRMSRFEQELNNSDPGILSVETTAQIYKVFNPPINIPYAMSCNLGNILTPGTIVSSLFTVGSQSFIISDKPVGVDSNGTLYLIQENTTNATQNYSKIGNVDYSTGQINIDLISYSNIFGGLKLFGTPFNQDIYCSKNTVIEIDIAGGLVFNVVNG